MQTVSNDITVAEEAAEAHSLSLTPTNMVSPSSVYNWVVNTTLHPAAEADAAWPAAVICRRAATIKSLASAFANRSVFTRITQTGSIHLHGSYLQLIHDSFLFYAPSGYDLGGWGADMLPLPRWAKKYFSYSLYFLEQILWAFKFTGEGEWRMRMRISKN